MGNVFEACTGKKALTGSRCNEFLRACGAQSQGGAFVKPNHKKIKDIEAQGYDILSAKDVDMWSSMTGLHWASRRPGPEFVETISLLVQLSPLLLNMPDADGYTPLMKAVEAGNKEGVKRLLELGCDVSLSTKWPPQKTAVDIASALVASEPRDSNAKDILALVLDSARTR